MVKDIRTRVSTASVQHLVEGSSKVLDAHSATPATSPIVIEVRTLYHYPPSLQCIAKLKHLAGDTGCRISELAITLNNKHPVNPNTNSIARLKLQWNECVPRSQWRRQWLRLGGLVDDLVVVCGATCGDLAHGGCDSACNPIPASRIIHGEEQGDEEREENLRASRC